MSWPDLKLLLQTNDVSIQQGLLNRRPFHIRYVIRMLFLLLVNTRFIQSQSKNEYCLKYTSSHLDIPKSKANFTTYL